MITETVGLLEFEPFIITVTASREGVAQTGNARAAHA
jgi:hypothetical protein